MIKKSKYQIKDFVLINKVFSTDNDSRGMMETIARPLIARIIHVEYTSLGPSYKLEILDKSYSDLKIRYWESDILSHFDI
tara:strand:- start:371 stop:610 length:240 start_codon:yes stop_codon:yes gene_type:complete